jgi:predicted dehydrogenase
MMGWGILGTGNIAAQFARGLTALDDAQLIAVGSRTAASATAFADQFDVPHRHSSSEALAADPDVHVIYVATPHPLHHANTLLCLRAGKAVVCEKPFALNAGQAADMIAEARQRKLFLMDAMWTRFLPHMTHIRDLIANGAIGEVRMVRADFCFRTAFDPQHRLFDPALGGGALLDVGVYPVALASMMFGTPVQISSAADVGATGVDEQVGIVCRYERGQLAILSAATRTDTPHEAVIAGTGGHIRVHHAWWAPTSLTLERTDQPPEAITPPIVGNGYNYEAAEAMRCIRAGATESPVMPLDETLSIMRTLDAIRAQIGVRYPDE